MSKDVAAQSLAVGWRFSLGLGLNRTMSQYVAVCRRNILSSFPSGKEKSTGSSKSLASYSDNIIAVCPSALTLRATAQ
jgi:hypothetical protein